MVGYFSFTKTAIFCKVAPRRFHINCSWHDDMMTCWKFLYPCTRTFPLWKLSFLVASPPQIFNFWKLSMCDQFSFNKMTIFINIAPIGNCPCATNFPSVKWRFSSTSPPLKIANSGLGGGLGGGLEKIAREKNYARKICVAAIQKLRCTSSRPAASPAPGFRRSPLLPTPLLPHPLPPTPCCLNF